MGGAAEYWDAVAGRYLELFRDELQTKPYDFEVLQAFAAALGRGARVCDAGCGPCGHVTRYLADHGLDMTGVDLSANCIALARSEQPALHFEQMDMSAMAFADAAFDGLVAYYSLHYQPKGTLDAVMKEFLRVLRPEGRLLVVVKEGEGEGWMEDPLGSGRQVFWAAFTPDEMQALIARNRFRVLSCTVRDALPEELQVRRIYITAERTPGT